MVISFSMKIEVSQHKLRTYCTHSQRGNKYGSLGGGASSVAVQRRCSSLYGKHSAFKAELAVPNTVQLANMQLRAASAFS